MQRGKLLLSLLVLSPVLAASGPVLYSSDGLAFRACWDCLLCTPTTEHIMADPNPNRPSYQGGHDWCVLGACEGGHSTEGCGLLAQATDEVKKLVAAAEAGNETAPAQLQSKWPRSFEWNVERRSLQVTSPCMAGHYVANIPLTDEQVSALSRQASRAGS